MNLADTFPEIRALMDTYGAENVSPFQYSDGGVQATVSGLDRPELGPVTRYFNGDAETTITIR
jgi:hypothetical protein